MNKNLIGLNAGKVWQLLNNNKRWSYSELKEAVGLSDRDLNAAIGWLAREDNIISATAVSILYPIALNVSIIEAAHGIAFAVLRLS